jgi:hypothetical protein
MLWMSTHHPGMAPCLQTHAQGAPSFKHYSQIHSSIYIFIIYICNHFLYIFTSDRYLSNLALYLFPFAVTAYFPVDFPFLLLLL